MDLSKLYQISDYEWSIPKTGDMNVDGYIIGSQKLVSEMDDAVYQQLMNAATLPGILYRVIALPDAHTGYGFPIGATAAFDMSDGVIVPGAVGYDINCGVRVITTNLIFPDIEKKVESLIREMYKVIPSGMGEKGKISLSKKELNQLLTEGAKWVIENRGYGKDEDLDYIEDGGVAPDANPDYVSADAFKREKNQLGTLGAGNHYLELQIVDEIFDIERARVFGLFKNQVVVTVHTGSRGFGHQIGTDFIKQFSRIGRKYDIKVPNRELGAAPVQAEESKQYLGAMRCAINYAFANRQIIYGLVDKVLNDVIKDVDTNIMYDLGHNTLKIEEHKIGSTRRKVLVYRKGSTRNFSGVLQDVVKPYRISGQPIIVGGLMGSYSYVLAGTEDSLAKTFGTSVHGAGRNLSRMQAKRHFDYNQIVQELKEKGIYLKSKSRTTAVEEAPGAYKDIEDVIKSVNKSNISIRVARLKPIGVLKG